MRLAYFVAVDKAIASNEFVTANWAYFRPRPLANAARIIITTPQDTGTPTSPEAQNDNPQKWRNSHTHMIVAITNTLVMTNETTFMSSALFRKLKPKRSGGRRS